MDLTSDLNLLLKSHDCPPIRHREFRVDDLDEFLKEAYRIVGHVALQPERGN
jgi:phosphoglycerate dehydrogenase-like enzyme